VGHDGRHGSCADGGAAQLYGRELNDGGEPDDRSSDADIDCEPDPAGADADGASLAQPAPAVAESDRAGEAGAAPTGRAAARSGTARLGTPRPLPRPGEAERLHLEAAARHDVLLLLGRPHKSRLPRRRSRPPPAKPGAV